MYLILSFAFFTTSFSHCCLLQAFNNNFKQYATHLCQYMSKDLRLFLPIMVFKAAAFLKHTWMTFFGNISFDHIGDVLDILCYQICQWHQQTRRPGGNILHLSEQMVQLYLWIILSSSALILEYCTIHSQVFFYALHYMLVLCMKFLPFWLPS